MSYLLEHEDTTPVYQIKDGASSASKAFMDGLWNDANRKYENLSTRKAMNIGRDAWKLNPNQAWKDMRLKVATAIEMGRLPIDDFVRIQSAGTLAAQMVTPAPEQNSLNVEDIVTKVIAALDARDAAKQSSQEKPKED
tara:strand:- start:3478 stop:3891 length:414 start_codon:yes stop_codon:yes gene_type:complete